MYGVMVHWITCGCRMAVCGFWTSWFGLTTRQIWLLRLFRGVLLWSDKAYAIFVNLVFDIMDWFSRVRVAYGDRWEWRRWLRRKAVQVRLIYQVRWREWRLWLKNKSSWTALYTAGLMFFITYYYLNRPHGIREQQAQQVPDVACRDEK